ncbi:RidA family protein [Phenylobacterium sp. 20VBR1]|uniref:RidA family protein n=1 Tax=Phenylobacterium glaciei TaxID=2803784 RepID=A0A941D450_9CAUL|nr:RidA family protein [Phenylobacterium glaciei]MBR7621292.1 RidA family protein [Phenylobacterium glaciei]QQZ49945.1 RidA family protein [Phenylobacterium glaciei]
MRRLILAALLPVLAAAAVPASAADAIVRVGPPTAAILQGAVVPAGYDIFYVSGQTPPPLNAGAPAGTPVEFGDTKTQTIGIMKKIDAVLKTQGYTMGDVVMMRVYLVGDPAKGGKMDFAGMMEGYTQFFGSPDQPNKVARVTMQVAALVAPGMLAEIEVQAAKKK